MKLPDPKEYFTQYLKQHGNRITPERFIVLDAVLSTESHFDADELYLQMKNAGSKVSRATVYNTLETLEQCGILARYRFGERMARYECMYGADHHHHIICRLCGRIEEFVDKRLDRFTRDAANAMEYELHHSVLHIYGMCAPCRTDAEGEESQ